MFQVANGCRCCNILGSRNQFEIMCVAPPRKTTVANSSVPKKIGAMSDEVSEV